MDALNRIVGGLGWALLAVAVVGVMLSVLVGTVDVVRTQVFLSPLHGAIESITELMVIIVFVALPWVQRARGHIRVDLHYAHLGPLAQATLDALTAAASSGWRWQCSSAWSTLSPAPGRRSARHR